MMDSRILEHPHAQFGGMVGFPYPLGHHHVYELAGHQLQSAAASVPFSIDGLLSGSCAASVVNPAPLLPSGCGVSGDSQPFKLAGRSGPVARVSPRPRPWLPARSVSAPRRKTPHPRSPSIPIPDWGCLGGRAGGCAAPRGGGRPRSGRRERSPFPARRATRVPGTIAGPAPACPKVHRAAAPNVPLKDCNKNNNGNRWGLGNEER